MVWKCGECGAIEGKDRVPVNLEEHTVDVYAICHHCGKLLCQKDRVLIKDDDFDGTMVEAYHCEECKKTFHPNSIVIKG
jgi:DNA-directed RNA polymerase subunit RPC12/RpoP